MLINIPMVTRVLLQKKHILLVTFSYSHLSELKNVKG